MKKTGIIFTVTSIMSKRINYCKKHRMLERKKVREYITYHNDICTENKGHDGALFVLFKIRSSSTNQHDRDN